MGEECWEVGSTYIQNAHMLVAVKALVVALKAAQKGVPAFARMCDDCDAELFLVLPRLVWLSFLAQPVDLAAWLMPLLPHHFFSSDLDPSIPPQQGRAWNDEVDCFLAMFSRSK